MVIIVHFYIPIIYPHANYAYKASGVNQFYPENIYYRIKYDNLKAHFNRCIMLWIPLLGSNIVCFKDKEDAVAYCDPKKHAFILELDVLEAQVTEDPVSKKFSFTSIGVDNFVSISTLITNKQTCSTPGIYLEGLTWHREKNCVTASESQIKLLAAKMLCNRLAGQCYTNSRLTFKRSMEKYIDSEDITGFEKYLEPVQVLDEKPLPRFLSFFKGVIQLSPDEDLRAAAKEEYLNTIGMIMRHIDIPMGPKNARNVVPNAEIWAPQL